MVNTGNSFVIIGIKDKQTLAHIRPDFDLIDSVSERLDLIGYYLFTEQTSQPGRDVATRMLAPRYGINEVAATGMAAGPLACYLHREMTMKKDHFGIEQGFLMQPPSPSVIDVNFEIKGNAITSLMAGGVARLSAELVVDI